MHGIVAKWVEDCWKASHAGAPADGRPGVWPDCRLRVLRGGSWLNSEHLVRLAFWLGVLPGDRYATDGFRLARSPR